MGAWVFGERLVCLLNGEGFPGGKHPSVEIVLDSNLEPGNVEVRPSEDPWDCFAHVGIPEASLVDPDLTGTVKEAIITALKFIRPEFSETIDRAVADIEKHGDDIRFLFQVKETQKYLIEVYFKAPGETEDEDISLFIGVTNKATGQFLEGPRTPIFTFSVPPFGHEIRIKISEIEKQLSDFKPRERPFMSKLVKW